MSRRLRVAHVINTLGLGGVPTAAWQLMRGLPAARHDLLLYVLGPGQGEDQARRARLESFRELGVSVTLAGHSAANDAPHHDGRADIEPHLTEPPQDTPAQPAGRAASANLRALPARAASTWSTVGRLAQWLREQRVDIVHTHSYKPNLHGRLAAALLQADGLGVVAHYHNDYDDKWDLDGSDVLERELAPVTDAMLACSAAVARHTETRLGLRAGRVRVLHNGVDTAVFTPRPRDTARTALGLPIDRPIVAIVGRISAQKAQDVFLHMAAQVGGQLPDTLFLVVGSSDDAALLASLHELARSLGLGPQQLRFTGHLDGAARMAELYSAVDLLVAPSRWEGFGLMLVEAMACGLPIVASRVGAIADVVVDGQTAVLVPPDEVPALCHAVLDLLRCPERRAAMTSAAPRRAQAFSWQASADQLADLYRQLAGDRSERA